MAPEWTFRLRDMALSALLLLALAPLLGIITLILLITQRRVFFFQTRPGWHEAPFTLIKFSTLRDLLPGENETADLSDRLTPVGRYLRKWSLDETPQLFLVLIGKMALVGPRPLLMEYLPLYTPEQRQRSLVRPGITGWAQVNGRNALRFSERFALDVWYVNNRSHRLDIKIMWLTLATVGGGKGVFVKSYETAEKYDGTN